VGGGDQQLRPQWQTSGGQRPHTSRKAVHSVAETESHTFEHGVTQRRGRTTGVATESKHHPLSRGASMPVGAVRVGGSSSGSVGADVQVLIRSLTTICKQ
jgi:hypothetical protein